MRTSTNLINQLKAAFQSHGIKKKIFKLFDMLICPRGEYHQP